jgi:hypothetical protein
MAGEVANPQRKPLWTSVGSWEVLGWVAATLYGLGGVLLGLNEFGHAKRCFILANAILLVRVAIWAFGPGNRLSWRHNLVFGLTTVALVTFSLAGIAWINKRSLPSIFRITRFERNPYELGKPFSVNIYYRYDGDEAIRIRGYSYFEFHHLAAGEAKPDKLREIETAMWERMLQQQSEPSHGVMIEGGASAWITQRGPVLSQAMLDDLQPMHTGAMFFMGYFKYLDGHSDYTKEFCVFTQSNPEVFVSCEEHNGPPAPTGPIITVDKWNH